MQIICEVIKLENARFSSISKKLERLVLLRKGHKLVDDPTSYRSICLLNVEEKFYELSFLQKFKMELNRIDEAVHTLFTCTR